MLYVFSHFSQAKQTSASFIQSLTDYEPKVLTVGPTGKSGASVSETAIVSVYLDKRMPRRGAERFSGRSGKCRAKDTPDRGQRPRGLKRKGRAEERNVNVEPRREVD